jgi:uncharacterized protein (TIGR00730 family)
LEKFLGVFGASSGGNLTEIERIIPDLAREISLRRWSVICGGCGSGMMRTFADSLLESGVKVVGVVPDQPPEMPHPHLTELVRVADTAERKRHLLKVSDQFLALPGGIGTIDEIISVLVDRRLGLLKKDITLFNVDSYYSHFVAMIDEVYVRSFSRVSLRDGLSVCDTVEDLLLAIGRA